MNSLLLTGGRVIDPANDFDARAEVLICDGKIAAVGPAVAGRKGIRKNRRTRG
ncbi:MAG: dihydroorotase [Verrucomicrobia bacterium ADurb.Bin063]|nr:MAG: dihydroorotase [Verrucomicrobia bacterium ADurb.Bin063]